MLYLHELSQTFIENKQLSQININCNSDCKYEVTDVIS